MLNKILGLVFGKDPDIFDAQGNVVHKLPEDLWARWRGRFENNVRYDWKKHVGTERTPRKPKI